MHPELNQREKPDNQPSQLQQLQPRQHPAQWVFALLLVLLSFWLLANLSEQAKFPSSKSFITRPGFWPAISLSGMAFFSCCFLYSSWRNRPHERAAELVSELKTWLAVAEYPLWFLAYVGAVPQLGYLPSSILFVSLMSYRLGYRSKAIYLAGLLSAVATVVIFKSLLEVKIPGGASYQYLPEGVRNFMIVYL